MGITPKEPMSFSKNETLALHHGHYTFQKPLEGLGCVFFVLFWVMGGFLCYKTLLFWFSLQGVCKGPKVVLFFSCSLLDG
jgi:hypothetical protein